MERLSKISLWALVALALIVPVRVEAEQMDLFLVPIETINNQRSPKYFCPMGPPTPECITGGFVMMDYGFTDVGLLIATDLSAEDRADLHSYEDVFTFPDNLDGPVDQDIQAFFEGVHLPTDWMTPSTTWRELLRQVAGIFQFNQRYMGIVANLTGELHSIWDTATLDTRLNQMTADEQAWFLLAVESFGFDPNLVNLNSRLRLLVRQASSYWEGRSFYLGGLEF